MQPFRPPLLLLLVVLLAAGLGCRKYQYGPYLSLASKKERIEGSWKVDSAITQQGLDVGPLLESYRFIFEKDGSALITFQAAGSNEPDSLYGEWELQEEKDLFTWIGLTGDTLGFYYTRNETFDILRLTGQEFWLADKDNTFLYLSQ